MKRLGARQASESQVRDAKRICNMRVQINNKYLSKSQSPAKKHPKTSKTMRSWRNGLCFSQLPAEAAQNALQLRIALHPRALHRWTRDSVLFKVAFLICGPQWIRNDQRFWVLIWEEVFFLSVEQKILLLGAWASHWLSDVEASFCVAGARDSPPGQKWAKREGFVAFPKTDGGRCKDACRVAGTVQMRDVRRLGRWFPERGCILEHQIYRFDEMILPDRCNTSYDLAYFFCGRRSTLDRWSGKIAKCIGTRHVGRIWVTITGSTVDWFGGWTS